jgi:hypothetical protein
LSTARLVHAQAQVQGGRAEIDALGDLAVPVANEPRAE